MIPKVEEGEFHEEVDHFDGLVTASTKTVVGDENLTGMEISLATGTFLPAAPLCHNCKPMISFLVDKRGRPTPHPVTILTNPCFK